jgi:hypothetical protein
MALLADSDLYEEVRQDPVVTHALEYLALLVAGTEWEVLPAPGDPKSERLVPFIKGALDHIHDFVWVRKYLTDAVLMGMAVGKKTRSGPHKARRIGSDVVPRHWTLVDSVEPIDKRRLEIERMWEYEETNDPTMSTIGDPIHYWKLYDPYNLNWTIIEDRAVMPQARMAHQDFVWHFSENREDRVGYGRGVLEVLYTCIRIKSHLTQYRAAYCEKHAMPWLIAKIDVMKRVSASGLASGDIKTVTGVISEFLDVLTQMQGRHVAVADKSDDIQVIEPTGSGNTHIADFIDYLDRVMTQLILGATLNTQQQVGAASSSYAQSRTHEASTDAVVNYHRTRLEETLRDDIVQGFINDNYSIFAAMGLADVDPPYIRLTDERKITPQMQGEMLAQAQNMGLGKYISVDKALEGMRLKKASPGEEVMGDTPGGGDMFGLGMDGGINARDGFGPGTGQASPPGTKDMTFQMPSKPVVGQDLVALSSLYRDAIDSEDTEMRDMVKTMLRDKLPKPDPEQPWEMVS